MANSKTKAFSRESKTSLQRENSKGYSYQSDEFNNNKRRIIDKVRLNRCCVYFCFCFARRRKILTNVLINEGMDLISCKLDIFNLFDKMYKADQTIIPLLQKKLPFSDDCKNGLKFVNLKYLIALS